MLKNKKVVYFCQECGYESSKWMGQCPGCRAWNTFVEETVSTKKVSSTGSGLQNGLRRAEPVVLKDIRLSEDERKLTNIGELDRVLGGGIVPGSFSCFAFVSFPPPLESGPNPAYFPRVGYTVGQPLKAAHSGSHGATRRYICISGDAGLCSDR